MNKMILRIEGAAVLILSVYFYWYFQFSWLFFFLLFFAPDVSLLGYLVNTKVGAVVYNLFHTYSLPIVVILGGMFFPHAVVLALGLVWMSHIALDRMLGFGLKYPTHFKDTHFQRV